jgi:putative inorganic carbon (hco3(-)) transporter
MDSTNRFRSFPLKAANLFIGWRGQWLGAFGLAIFAIFTWLPNSYKRMVDWPWIMGWQIGLLAIGIFGFWMLRRFKTPFKPLGYGLDGAVGSLVLVIISSSVVAEFPEVAALNSVLCLFYVAALYIFYNWVQQSPITHRSLWLWLCGVGSITSLVSLALWKPTKEMWLSSSFDDAIRNGLPLGHHNFMGGYLILTFPLITIFALTQTSWKKWLGFVMSILSVIALYTTGSRGAWMGAIAIVLTTIVVSVSHSQGRQRYKALAISVIGLCLIFLVLFSNPRIRNMVAIQSTTDSFSHNKQAFVLDGPTKDRWFMAQATKNIVQENPLLGVGPGNLARVYNLYRPIEAGTGLDLVQQLHSLPLQVFGELGLLGMAAYIWSVICLLRLWLKLASTNLQHSNRYLLYGIGASFLGYGVSSLTDYQLENIGIASTLLILTVLLIGIANQEHLDFKQDNTSDFSIRLRRILSLALLGLLGLAIKFWMPTDIAMYFNHSAAANLILGNIATADMQWAKAAAITPWDPVPNALAGQAIVDIIGSVDLEEKAKILNEQAISDYKAALKAAPNDVWFNNNLAILYLPSDDRQAEYYASRAVQLAPRTQNYLYFTLGLAYLSQNKRQLAIQSFALECLENSAFISMDLWEQAPFDSVRSETIAQATDYYEQLLTLITPNSSQYNQLYEQRALIRWWHHLDNPNIEMKRIRPLLQAIFLAESQPKRSLEIIENQMIQAENNTKGMKLVRVWIDPQKYLNEYISSEDIDNAEKSLLQEHIEKQTSLQSWFKSVVIPSEPRKRYGLSFAYRNADANYIVSILQPGALNQSMIANVLGMFSQMPREFPELEQLMETIRTQQLGLRHPTQNGFQLVSPADLHK